VYHIHCVRQKIENPTCPHQWASRSAKSVNGFSVWARTTPVCASAPAQPRRRPPTCATNRGLRLWYPLVFHVGGGVRTECRFPAPAL